MYFLKYSALFFCAALFAGCAATPRKTFPPPNDYIPISQVQTTSRFSTIEVTRETLGVEINKCVPQIEANAQNISQWAKNFPNDNIVKFGHVSSSKSFVLRQTTGFCLQKSSEKFPIFAAEAFISTVNPSGVPPDVTDDWYKQIALLIATKGVATVAYVFGNGNAYTATYWVEPHSDYSLFYSAAFKKAGTWETGKFDVQFSHPTMASASETKRSGEGRKVNLIEHRPR